MNIDKKRFQTAILKWSKKNYRSFPWRETEDPFKILIAEIILRMTGAWKVQDAYLLLEKRFGTPHKMSVANILHLNKIFKPLGLYKRGELLIDIGKEIEIRFKGKVPDTFDALISISGVGRYTANAILCIGYGQKVPMVDGSVERIIKRCFNFKSSKPAYSDNKLWDIASSLLPEKKCKEFNLGLLDLAALVCKPKNPIHEYCPVKGMCYNIKSMK